MLHRQDHVLKDWNYKNGSTAASILQEFLTPDDDYINGCL
jgi:hypothetical protein